MYVNFANFGKTAKEKLSQNNLRNKNITIVPHFLLFYSHFFANYLRSLRILFLPMFLLSRFDIFKWLSLGIIGPSNKEACDYEALEDTCTII